MNAFMRIVWVLLVIALAGCGGGGGGNGGDPAPFVDDGGGGNGGGTTPPVQVAPSIVRQPANVATHDHGSALLFVVAAGSSLTYEWRARESGTVVQSGPEPFLLRENQDDLTDDGNCYEVTVSNSLGTVTSDQVCTSVALVSYDFNEDGGDVEPEADMAMFFGNALLALIENTIGPLTGPTLVSNAGFPPVLGPAQPCVYEGSFLGATLDAETLTALTPLPLGEHRVSLAYDQCRGSSDQTIRVHGVVLSAYNFPSVFGIGSSTFHFSGFSGSAGPDGYFFVMNGPIEVTSTRSVNANGPTVDEFLITPQPGFTIGNSAGVLKEPTDDDTLTVRRTLSADLQTIETATVDFGDHRLELLDVQGLAEVVHAHGSVTFNADGSSSGDVDVDSTDQPASPPHVHGTLVPSAWSPDWAFDLAPP